MPAPSDAESEVMEGILGHVISKYQVTPEGMHFFLDDGRIVLFSGTFFIAVYSAEAHSVH